MLVYCSGRAAESSIYSIESCSFSGFQYAIRGTERGYPGSLRRCTISDCEYGLYVNCPGLNGTVNTDVSWNTFIRCQDAICIPRLPDSITSYIYRIHDNIFIDCGRDLNITQSGSFYCYGNFFGTGEVDSVRRTASLNAGESTRIIVNPCRESRIWQEGDPYWIDPALPTEIVNEDANSFVIDADALDKPDDSYTGFRLEISVWTLGEHGLSMIGFWSFGW